MTMEEKNHKNRFLEDFSFQTGIDPKKENKTMRLRALVIVFLATFMAACGINDKPENKAIHIEGSGNIISAETAVSEFNQIEAGLHFDLSISKGDESRVVVFSDDNFIEFIQTKNVDGNLIFDLKPGYAYDFKRVTLRAEVILPRLTALRLNGSSHAHLNDFGPTDAFSAELTGSSSLTGGLNTSLAELQLFGSSFTELTGSGEVLRAAICGNSVLNLQQYVSDYAAIDASCNSQAIVNVAEELDVEASQHARIYYQGHPAMDDIKIHEFATIEPAKQ
jgi:hypothetical protein